MGHASDAAAALEFSRAGRGRRRRAAPSGFPRKPRARRFRRRRGVAATPQRQIRLAVFIALRLHDAVRRIAAPPRRGEPAETRETASRRCDSKRRRFLQRRSPTGAVPRDDGRRWRRAAALAHRRRVLGLHDWKPRRGVCARRRRQARAVRARRRDVGDALRRDARDGDQRVGGPPRAALPRVLRGARLLSPGPRGGAGKRDLCRPIRRRDGRTPRRTKSTPRPR